MTTKGKNTTKGQHGGARPGAGRPRKPSPSLAVVPTDDSPLAFLLAVMQDAGQGMATRLRAAVAALPYCHARMTATTKPASTRPQQGAGQVFPAASRFRPSRSPDPKH